MLTLVIRPEREAIFKALMPVALIVAVIERAATPAPLPLRRIAAENVRKYAPGNAIVISAIDPVYLERVAAAGSFHYRATLNMPPPFW